jgi:DNA topoisomerase-2
MILVNGSHGVGIGWKSFVPKYNPKDIIKNIRRKFNNESVEEMTPWYKDFNGTVVAKKEATDTLSYYTNGVVSSGKHRYTYHITELPIGKSIEEYKKFLQSRSEGTTTKKTLFKVNDSI